MKGIIFYYSDGFYEFKPIPDSTYRYRGIKHKQERPILAEVIGSSVSDEIKGKYLGYTLNPFQGRII